MMKKIFLLILVTKTITLAQIDVSASMGLDFKYASSYRDYINTSFAMSNQLPSFKSAVTFNATADYKLDEDYAIGIEHSILIDSYNAQFGVGGVYELAYEIQRPTLIGYYIIPGAGYQFKFGVGLGLRFVSLSERILTEINYKSSGYGFLLKAEGNTLLSQNFYALIGGNLRIDKIGDVENNGKFIVNRNTKENLNMNSISFGIYLGITYTF